MAIKYLIMIEERGYGGETSDFFGARHWDTEKPYIYDTLDEAVEHVVKGCGSRFAPSSGKYTYHVYEVTDTDEFIRDILYNELSELCEEKFYNLYMKEVANA